MKKYLSLFLCLILLFGLLPLAAPARAASSGDWEYEIDGGTATITKYNGTGGSVTIPSTLGSKPVTIIGDYAFDGCTGLTSVSVPDSVTSIGSYAFYNCTGLTRVNISDLAAWCAIKYDTTCPEPGNGNPLKYAHVLYLNGKAVTELTIPDGVTYIGNDAFYGCTSLTSVTIPDSVTSIGDWAFCDCTGLTSVTIPDSVTFIGDDAFLECTSLTRVDITDLAAWCAVKFECDEMAGDTTSNPLTYAHALYLNGKEIKVLKIPDGVTGIGDCAFVNCTGLTSVTIPGSVTNIGESAFSGCTGLSSVTISKSVTSISHSAFYSCTGLADVYYGGTEEEWGEVDIGWNNDPLTYAAIHFPEPLAISGVKANKTGAAPGTAITWTASAAGGVGTLKYYFILYKDGTQIATRAYSKAKTFSYTPTDAGTYKVKVYVKDADGTKVYKVSTAVTVAAPPVITAQPANQSVASGATATFTVAVSGMGLTYQWQYSKDGGATWYSKSGATTASCSVAAKTSYDGFLYRCKVKNAGGTVYSDSAKLTVTAAAAPVISSVKAGFTSAYAGEKITWTAAASGGSGTLKYYFILYKDGVKVKTRSYSTTRTFSYTPTEAGSYKVKVYVKDADGTKSYKTGGQVAVTLGPPAIISVKAGKTSSVTGEEITWTAAAVGSEQPLKYYFILYKDGAKIKTRTYSTANTFSYTPSEGGTYKVRVYVKDAEGTKVSKLSGGVTVSVLNPGQQQSGIKLTNGNPSGNAKTISFTTRNELTGGKSGTARAFTAQPLDNGYTRFSLSYSIPEQMFISVFSPPDGALFKLLGQTENAAQSGNLIFDLKNKDLNAIDEVSIKFYQSDSEAFWVFFFTDQLK